MVEEARVDDDVRVCLEIGQMALKASIDRILSHGRDFVASGVAIAFVDVTRSSYMYFIYSIPQVASFKLRSGVKSALAEQTSVHVTYHNIVYLHQRKTEIR